VSDFDDLDFNRNVTLPMLAPPPPRPSWIGPAVLLVIFLVLLGGFWWYRAHRTARAPQAASTGLVPATRTAPPPPPAATSATNLPPLTELDPFIRSNVGSLTQMSAATTWLATDHLAEQFTAIVQGVAEGKAPSRMLARFRPQTPFAVIQRGGQTVIDPDSYARYDGIADTVTSLDAAASVNAYRMLSPRLNEAYAQLGITDSTLDAALERAIIRLVKTPVPDGDIAVVPRGAAYAFANADLEALSPAQKLLLRTGPANARRIQARLREIGLALGISADQL
jgi:DUF3014 family protein